MPDLISVVIPVYNRTAILAETVASVLAQTYRPLEILVVDDGSTEDVAAALAGLPRHDANASIVVIRQENQGPGAARNRAIRSAWGALIALLDSDDAWLPTKLERQVASLSAHPDASFCYCQFSVPAGSEVLVRPASPQSYEELIRQKLRIAPSTLLLRREVFERVGYFRSDVIGPEDFDFVLRLMARDTGVFVEEPLVRMRRDGDNLSGDPLRVNAGRATLFESYWRDGFPRGPEPALARQGWMYYTLRAADACLQAGQASEARRRYLAALRVSKTAGVEAGRWDRTRSPRPIRDFVTPYLRLVWASLRAGAGSR